MSSDPTTQQAEALRRLQSAVASSNDEEAEWALAFAWQVGLHPILCNVLIELAEAPWHMRHEDVVQAIQQLRCDSAVEALQRTARSQYDYLGYDEFFGLARKCTWALADIGTPEAKEALERLADSENALIVGYARKRLVHWEDEQDRKGKWSR
jgi:hypothetical protein